MKNDNFKYFILKSIDVLEVFIGNKKVGRLAQTKEGLCAFEYEPAFIQNGFSISPLELPLQHGVFIAKASPFNGNFGVFDDCLPDGWGMLILDRYLQRNGIQPRFLSLLDRLSLVGASGRGALEFRPDQSAINQSDFKSFEMLAAESKKILSTNDYVGESIDTFYYQGGSPGGARPKVFVNADGKEWLVKFRASNDPENIGSIEFDYSLLAKKCGVEMPVTRLFDGKYFGVERFDRSGQNKIHVVSVGGLLRADYRSPCLDYTSLFQLCQMLTRNAQEMWKLYRLMVFNFIIGNKDDHAKNFAFIYLNNEWHLSPAYDILPSDGMNGFHTTSINNNITPTKEDVLAVALQAGLERSKVIGVYEEMSSVVGSL